LHVTDDPSKIGIYSGLVVSYCSPSMYPVNGSLNVIHRRAVLLFRNCSLFITGRGYQVHRALRAFNTSTHCVLLTSDVAGRRPVILIGTTGIAVTTILFGLSGTFTALLVSRFLGASPVHYFAILAIRVDILIIL
jgi:hypothetical protein